MNTVLYYICVPLGMLMKLCWNLVGNYGAAILLFTLATKIILLPLSVWIHKNSILMVKIQPEINFLKVKYYGDGDTVAEEQAKLFKRAKYHPLLSLVPLFLQILLLLGVVYIINRPLTYLLGIGEDTVMRMAQALGISTDSSSYELEIIRQFKSFSEPFEFSGNDEAVRTLELSLFGLDLTAVPTVVWGIYSVVPIIAGASSWFLCFSQNKANVLQHEQGKWNQYGVMIFSILLSVYLGCFVPSGIALYWITGNILSVFQLYALNAIINPKKYVNYAELERSREELRKLEELEPKTKKDPDFRENKKRERQDYKKFFKIVNKHLVIYSEKSGFYNYFKGLISELTARSSIIIHYVTNDPKDIIFEVAKENKQIKPYYIGIKKTIPLMMKLEADMVVMTTPDLNKYYLKKSIMSDKVEYVYIPHALMSMHMGMKEGSLDAFDTVFCAGEHIAREVRATEKYYGLPEKKLVEFGYPLVDDLLETYAKQNKTDKVGARKEILIAPTWNEDNILDSCIDIMLEKLLCDEYHVTVRPHPEYVKRYGAKMKAIVDKWADKVGEGLTFELDFSSNKSIYSSDLMITDWSGISFEFSFATKRPTLFVNTKMKVLNQNWDKIGCEPIEITLRDEIGVSIEKADVENIDRYIVEMLENNTKYQEKIESALHKAVYNVGTSNKVGAKYILKRLTDKSRNND